MDSLGFLGSYWISVESEGFFRDFSGFFWDSFKLDGILSGFFQIGWDFSGFFWDSFNLDGILSGFFRTRWDFSGFFQI